MDSAFIKRQKSYSSRKGSFFANAEFQIQNFILREIVTEVTRGIFISPYEATGHVILSSLNLRHAQLQHSTAILVILLGVPRKSKIRINHFVLITEW